jgi:hypothetical protein
MYLTSRYSITEIASVLLGALPNRSGSNDLSFLRACKCPKVPPLLKLTPR